MQVHNLKGFKNERAIKAILLLGSLTLFAFSLFVHNLNELTSAKKVSNAYNEGIENIIQLPGKTDNLYEWTQLREAEYETRKAKIRQICSQRENSLMKSKKELNKNDYAMMIDAKHKFLYCAHPKAASTTVKEYLARLADLPEESINDMHLTVSHYYAIQKLPDAEKIKSVADLKDYIIKNDILTFTFVRHPMNRLVSAFENKILYAQDPAFKKIAKPLKKDFTRFIDLVIKENHGKGYANIHWMPQYKLCHYCELDYDVIGKSETFDDDIYYIFHSLNITQKLLPEDKIEKKNSNSRNSSRTDYYLNQLTEEARNTLFDIFELDMLLFGYE